MLTQEELDKLLAEEGQETSSEETKSEIQESKGQEAKEGGQESGAMSQEELDGLLDGKKEDGDSGTKQGQGDVDGDDIDWSDAFKEAAEGGDQAAQKAVSEGLDEEGEQNLSPPPKESAPKAEFGELTSEADEGIKNKPELNFLLEIPLEIQVELGRCTMKIKELLQLGQGSIVELNKMAGEPADIYVNRKLMAKGEVVVVNEKFGIKLTEIISQEERVKSLG